MSRIQHEIAVSTWSLQKLTIAEGRSLEDLLPTSRASGSTPSRLTRTTPACHST